MIWLLAAVVILAAAIICAWRFRLLICIEIRESGIVLRMGIRLAGWIPAGTWAVELKLSDPKRIELSLRIFGIFIRIPLSLVSLRAFGRKRGPQFTQWISPAAHADILRRALRLREIRLIVRDLFLPLDMLCILSGVEKALRGLFAAFDKNISILLDRERDGILKIRADLVMNLVLLSKIGFRNIRKKVRSWSSTPLKTSCSRP